MRINVGIAGALAAALIFAGAGLAAAQTGTPLPGLPALNIVQDGEGGQTYSLSLQILALMTVLTVLPSFLLGMTSFTRIIIVLSILRQALGTQQTPPNQVLISVALFVTFFIMTPTLTALNDTALTPYLDGEITAAQAYDDGTAIMKRFLLANTRNDELVLFAEMSATGPYEAKEDVPFSVLLPAFITSELKTAFQIGFLIFLPFLVIDMVVASTLMSLGMMMLSPMLISLPFKLLLFVLVDGWSMTFGSIAATYASG